MSNFQKYLEAVRNPDLRAANSIPKEKLEAIKNAKTDDEAIDIALQYFKDPDDAEVFIAKIRK